MFKRRLSHPFFLIVLAGLLLALISGCGQTAGQSNAGANSQPAGAGNAGASGPEAQVAISGSAFQPGNITVKAGTTVIWTNQDGIKHQVHDDNNAFLSDPFEKGAAVGIVYSAAGTFTYHCHIHGNMKGTVIVE